MAEAQPEKRCFVPNCECTNGVIFPTEVGLKEKWLEGLNLRDAEPCAEDFVCLGHFNKKDLNDEYVPGSPDNNRIKKDAIPTIPTPQKKIDDVPPLVPIKVKTETETSNTNTRTCRVCMSKTAEKSILDNIEDNVSIMATLMLCAYPLEITKTDDLPKYICNPCLSKLKMAHYFRLKCLNSDKVFKKQCASEKNLQKSEEVPELPAPKRAKLETPKSVVKVERGTFQKIFVKSVYTDRALEKKMAEIHDEQAASTSNVDDSESDSLDAVLATLEGKEQFIIEKRNVEPKQPDKSEKKTVKKKGKWNLPKPRNSGIFSTVGQEESENSVLRSEIGEFPAEIIESVYNNIFCLADGYLFEFGLIKQGQRNIKCVVPLCPSFGQQNILDDDSVDDKVEVKIPHNHPPPDTNTKKKQMFFCIMKRKMQNDRSLNIRNIYEDFCKHDPAIKSLVPLRNVINEICKHQQFQQPPIVRTFDELYKNIESERFEKLHFTLNSTQFYQEKFQTDCGSLAIVFGNRKVIEQTSGSKVMYVDTSFKIESNETFTYQLVTVLVWVQDSYYPILFALVSKKTTEIFRKIFAYLHDVLAPLLRPSEIITDFEASVYYALSETYVHSHIGGSVFYFAQNLYKKICSLNMSHDLETNSYFRNVYHMLLMLPLLPVNTILDGLENIEIQAKDMGLGALTRPLFEYIRQQWVSTVTPELFCVHRLENRINENVIAPFKKLRDFLLLTKGKLHKTCLNIVNVVEKLIELESFLQNVYASSDKKTFGRDLSCYQKKNVLRAWQYIETHPKININNFFSKVLGYVKCMENQLWIWGFYRYTGEVEDNLIKAVDFSITNTAASAEEGEVQGEGEEETVQLEAVQEEVDETEVMMGAVIDDQGDIVLRNNENVVTAQLPAVGGNAEVKPQFESAFLKYVFQ